MMKRATPIVLFGSALFLMACGGEAPEIGQLQQAEKCIKAKKFLLIDLIARLDGISGQMELMESFSYTGVEMNKNDTTKAGDRYSTDTCHVDNYGTITMDFKTDTKGQVPDPCQSDSRLPPPIRLADVDVMKVSVACDAIVRYTGPKGSEAHLKDLDAKLTWVLTPSEPWAVIRYTKSKLGVHTYLKSGKR